MLQGWARAAADHWKEHRPKMYQELVESGELEARAEKAVELTKDALVDGLQKGLPYDQVWEGVREMWMSDPSNLASIMGSPKPAK
jgi:hypothetical protein